MVKAALEEFRLSDCFDQGTMKRLLRRSINRGHQLVVVPLLRAENTGGGQTPLRYFNFLELKPEMAEVCPAGNQDVNSIINYLIGLTADWSDHNIFYPESVVKRDI